MPAPEWSERFQRLVLALAVSGDWPAKFPDTLSGDLFAGMAPSALRPPRQRIAEQVARYWKERGEAPGVAVADELVRRDAERVSASERTVLLQEWEQVAATPLPYDAGFVDDQIREFVTYQRYSRALVQAAQMLEQPQRDFSRIQSYVSEELALGGAAARDVEALVAGADRRVLEWASDEAEGVKVPTGLPALDEALGGGPRVGESFYYIAPPKGAKTTFLLATALGAVRRRYGALFVSYEMRAKRVLYRADRSLARATKQELRQDPTMLDRAVRGLRAAGAGELYVWESTPQQSSACAEAARWVERIRRRGGRVDVVVLDYLNIMGSSKSEREKRHELARTSREISALAKSEGVVAWSAALVNRQAVDKKVIRKSDIAEAFEVIAVLDGGIAICGDAELRAARMRRLFATALREEEDEVFCGTYATDLARMSLTPVADLPHADGASADSSEGRGM